MAEFSRRGFLGLLAGAIAASAADGRAFVPDTAPTGPVDPSKPTKLKARHWYQYDAESDQFLHRIDVMIEDRIKGASQYGVDFLCESKAPTKESLEPALLVLCNHIEHEHGRRFELDIKSFELGDPAAYGFFTKRIGEK